MFFLGKSLLFLLEGEGGGGTGFDQGYRHWRRESKGVNPKAQGRACRRACARWDPEPFRPAPVNSGENGALGGIRIILVTNIKFPLVSSVGGNHRR